MCEPLHHTLLHPIRMHLSYMGSTCCQEPAGLQAQHLGSASRKEVALQASYHCGAAPASKMRITGVWRSNLQDNSESFTTDASSFFRPSRTSDSFALSPQTGPAGHCFSAALTSSMGWFKLLERIIIICFFSCPNSNLPSWVGAVSSSRGLCACSPHVHVALHFHVSVQVESRTAGNCPAARMGLGVVWSSPNGAGTG